MDENKTKEAFADICERVWHIALENIGFNKKMAPKTRQMVAQLVTVAWNATIACDNIKDAEESARIFNSMQLGGQKPIYDYLLEAVKIKWREYRDLKSRITGAMIENVDGKPKAIAILEGEIPEEDTDFQGWTHTMPQDGTKEHFADLCDILWERALGELDLDDKTTADARRMIAQLIMVAWNTCNTSENRDESFKRVKDFADGLSADNEGAFALMCDAVDFKWDDYKDDKAYISIVKVESFDGKPKAVAYLKGELPEAESATAAFHKFMESREVQERLKNVPPERLKEEIGKIIEEYNASIQPVSEIGDEHVPAKRIKSPKNFDKAKKHFAKYCEVFWEAALEGMKFSAEAEADVRELVMQLVASAWNALVVTGNVAKATKIVKEYNRDSFNGDKTFLKVMKEAIVYKDLHFANDNDVIEDTAIEFVDGKPTPVAFFKGEKHESENSEPEEYDFDKDNLRIFQLRVELLGYDVVADVQVPEDMTFEDLHDFLNNLFERDDSHLFRFECDDGLITVRIEEEIEDEEDEDARLSEDCFIGHHLSLENGAYYLFDYGDEWEHDIKVKKILKADPKEVYPKVIKIKGDIPEQYPDYDDED